MGLEPTNTWLGKQKRGFPCVPTYPGNGAVERIGSAVGDGLPTFARLSVPDSFQVKLSEFCGCPTRCCLAPAPLPTGQGRAYGLKWDGFRAIVSTEDGDIRSHVAEHPVSDDRQEALDHGVHLLRHFELVEVASAHGHPEVGVGLQRLQARRIVAASRLRTEYEQWDPAHQ